MGEKSYYDMVFQILGTTPTADQNAIAEIEAFESLHSVKLPESMREWFSRANAGMILKQCSNADSPLPPSKFELVRPKGVARYLDRVALNNDPFVLEDILPLYRKFESSVVFMYENQGGCRWSVELDGSNDPPVIVEVDGYDTEADCASVCSTEFSTFVTCQVLDYGPRPTGKMLYLNAQDVALSHRDLEYLQSKFEELPRTFGWPGLVNFRFRCPQGKIVLWASAGQTDWNVEAASSQDLRLLARTVWGCGEVAERFYAVGDSEQEAEEVLSELRSVT